MQMTSPRKVNFFNELVHTLQNNNWLHISHSALTAIFQVNLA